MNGDETQRSDAWLDVPVGVQWSNQRSSGTPTGPLGTWMAPPTSPDDLQTGVPQAGFPYASFNQNASSFDGPSAFGLTSSPSKNLRRPVPLKFVAAALFVGLRVYSAYQKIEEPRVPTVAESFGMTVAKLPHTSIAVHSDGCGVIRQEMNPAPHGLGWSVKDSAGFEVLQRNALGETQFRYPHPGSYSVELVAWDGEKYAPISNRLSVHC